MVCDQEIQFQVQKHTHTGEKVCVGPYSFLTGAVRMKEYIEDGKKTKCPPEEYGEL